jgi:pyruvate dehydrogenase E2 component (dihydrolipoamide acetyltransferase)
MATDYQLPDLGEDIDEAEVIAILVNVGDSVEEAQPIIEVETEKANLEVPAPYAGAITAVHVKVGDILQPGQIIVSIDDGNVPSSVETNPTVANIAAVPTEIEEAPSVEPAQLLPSEFAGGATLVPMPAAPSVRMFAREIGVAIEQVQGTGPGGRISVDDVKKHARSLRVDSNSAEITVSESAKISLPDLSQFGDIEREPMSGIRRATARTLSQSWIQSPHVTLQRKADITELDLLRRKHRERVAAVGGQLTLMPILMKVVAGALLEFPKLNASIGMETQEIVYRRYIHIGIATDTDRGLLVPVIRDVDLKNVTELAIEVHELVEKARNRRVAPDDLRGGTFTISNLGGMGVGFFNAILLPPQVGILAVGRAEIEPVWIDGEFQPRLRMPLALNFDHRLIDGADGARALSWIVEATEKFSLLT